jgi:hypothetical protein
MVLPFYRILHKRKEHIFNELFYRQFIWRTTVEHKLTYVRLQVLTAASMKFRFVFWDV